MQHQHFDLSSNKPHINNCCPFCCNEWMALVEEKSKCPKCGALCEMKKEVLGSVSIEWKTPPVLSKIIDMLMNHDFVVTQTGMERKKTGCYFAFRDLLKYEAVTDFQLEYPFYA